MQKFLKIVTIIALMPAAVNFRPIWKSFAFEPNKKTPPSGHNPPCHSY